MAVSVESGVSLGVRGGSSGGGTAATTTFDDTGLTHFTGDDVQSAIESGDAAISTLGGKYVRTTRFASIGAGTSGTVSLPANSTVVLDDFGGTVDAVVTTITGSRPDFKTALTAAGAVVAATFDGSGNYTLSGTPSAYPVGLVYRVRQTLSDFDSTSSDIVGPPEIMGAASAVPNDSGVTGDTVADALDGVDSSISSPRKQILRTTFYSSNNTYPFSATTAGTGSPSATSAVVSSSVLHGVPCAYQHQTGTSTGASGRITNTNTCLLTTGLTVSITTIFKLEDLPVSAGEDFSIFTGFTVAAIGNDYTSVNSESVGMWLSGADAEFQLMKRSDVTGSYVTSYVDTGLTVAADTWYICTAEAIGNDTAADIVVNIYIDTLSSGLSTLRASSTGFTSDFANTALNATVIKKIAGTTNRIAYCAAAEIHTEF